MQDPSLGPARKQTQVFTIHPYGALESVTRAHCRAQQLCQVRGLWPLQRFGLPSPAPSVALGRGGEERLAQGPKLRGSDSTLLCGLLEALTLEFSF